MSPASYRAAPPRVVAPNLPGGTWPGKSVCGGPALGASAPVSVGTWPVDGFEVCRRIREFSDAYLLMVTSRDEEIDKVVGLSVGSTAT